MTRVWRLVLLACALALAAGCGTAGEARTGVLDSPRPAPALAGTDLRGEPQDVAELRGSVVVVSAWASWCAPCREEMPVLAHAQRSLGEDGLRVLGLNVRDHPDAARRFAEEGGVSFPSVVDRDGTIAVDWGLRGMPETFLVDRGGAIVAHHFGPVTDAWVEDVVVPVVRP